MFLESLPPILLGALVFLEFKFSQTDTVREIVNNVVCRVHETLAVH